MKQHISKLKSQASKHKTLIQNFSYLSALQVFNLVIPLVTYPYLIRVLGKEVFGLVVFAQAIVGYLVILVSFGFNLSATKEISIHRNNPQKLNEIFSSILIIKGGLFFLSAITLSLLLFFIKEAKGYELLFYLTMWMCLYDFIFPIWYFQGIEQMKYITFITVISRISFLILIFMFIHKPEDYLLVPVIYGIGAIISGISTLWIIQQHKIRFHWQTNKILKHYFLDSLPIFISNLSTTISLSTNKVLLGIFLGMQDVAYYELAEKLSLIIKTPIHLIGQAIYPKVAQNKSKNFLKKTFLFSLLLAMLLLILGFLFSNFIIKTIGGDVMLNSSIIFQILLASIIPVTISLFYANIVLTSWGYNNDLLKLRIYTNALYFICIGFLILINLINLISLAITTLIIESFAALIAYRLCKKRKINFLNS